MKATTSKSDRIRIGWLVFVGLAVLTAVEFLIGALVSPAVTYLTLTALIKAALIVYYFMHINQLAKKEADH